MQCTVIRALQHTFHVRMYVLACTSGHVATCIGPRALLAHRHTQMHSAPQNLPNQPLIQAQVCIKIYFYGALNHSEYHFV
jgi:hypothetical protein